MFKTVNKDVWVFDVEWDLDPETGRRNFELAEDAQDIDSHDAANAQNNDFGGSD